MPKTLFDHRKEFLHIRYVSIYNFMADEGHVPPGGTSDASNPDWNAQIAQEEQLRRQEAAIKAAEDGEKDYPSASVGSVADKGADSIPRPPRLPSWTAWTCQMQKNWPMWASPWIPN